jgi:midasin (ATPase involved in ribosome maturation)
LSLHLKMQIDGNRSKEVVFKEIDSLLSQVQRDEVKLVKSVKSGMCFQVLKCFMLVCTRFISLTRSIFSPFSGYQNYSRSENILWSILIDSWFYLVLNISCSLVLNQLRLFTNPHAASMTRLFEVNALPLLCEPQNH